MRVSEEFDKVFEEYKAVHKREHLTYKVTSTFREGNPKTNPHSVLDNAMDLTLRWRGDYAPIPMYNHLMEYLMEQWPYRAGVDNTFGNIHIHIDLGLVKPEKQELPYFFLEDNQKWVKELKPGQLGGLG